MRVSGFILFQLLSSTLVAQVSVPPSGTLSGAVTDGSGKPLGNALVLYRSVQKPSTGPNGPTILTGPRVGSGVKTGADGRFLVRDLPPSVYHLCAYGTTDNQLGSCEWGPGTT
jgi:hypothetical protein